MDDAADTPEGAVCIEHQWRLANAVFTLRGVTLEEACTRCGEARLTAPEPPVRR